MSDTATVPNTDKWRSLVMRLRFHRKVGKKVQDLMFEAADLIDELTLGADFLSLFNRIGNELIETRKVRDAALARVAALEADAALGKALREAREAWAGCEFILFASDGTDKWAIEVNGTPQDHAFYGDTPLEALQAAAHSAKDRTPGAGDATSNGPTRAGR